MKAKPLFLAALLSAAASLTAAAQAPKEGQPQATEKRFHLDGKIVSIRPAAGQAVIDAKAIPGFMSAMAMPYVFKDTVELKKLKAGDHITGEVVISGGKTWVEKTVVVKDSAAAKK